ncbi:MAG TPA: hypothetical protein VFA04_06990 [Bryobacteraceae bacterium]|nr:hypothetical protein [Bryobacteraceae bacterium]
MGLCALGRAQNYGDICITTAGDIAYGGANGVCNRLGQPGNGLWGLTFASGVPVWTSVAGSMAAPSGGVFSASGPTAGGVITLSVSGNSGGVPYFSSGSAISSSAALSANALIKGGGAGAGPGSSSLIDNGASVSTTEPVLLQAVNQGTQTTERWYPNIASAHTDGSLTGSIVFHTPIGRSSGNMMRLHVGGYGYGTSSVVDFEILVTASSIQNGSVDGQPGVAYRYALIDNGSDGLSKYVGVDNAGHIAVAIGDTGTSWSFPRFELDAWMTRNPADYSSAAWTIEQGNTTSGFGWLDIHGPLTSGLNPLQVSGVAYPSAPPINSVPVVTGPNQVSYQAIPNAALGNSSLAYNGVAVPLGGSGNLGQLNDANGNASLKTITTAGAVDQISVTNSPTGNPATVTVSATGADPNVNLSLAAQGTGTTQVNNGLQENSTGAKPACGAAARGTLYVEKASGIGGSDQTLACVLDGAIYVWMPLSVLSPWDTTHIQWDEEFFSGPSASGSMGQLGWAATNIGAPTGAGASSSAGTAPNLGVIALSSGTGAAGTGLQILPNAGAIPLVDNLSTSGAYDSIWIAALAGTSNISARVGYFNPTNSSGVPNSGLYLRYDTGLQAMTGATYVSGGTVTGAAGQTCNVAFTGGTATATIALTGANSISGGVFSFTSGGGGYNASAPYTMAVLTSNTATCSGTVSITGVTLGAAGSGADSNFMVCSDSSSIETCVNTGAAADTNYHKVRIRQVSPGVVGMTLYDGAGTAQTAEQTFCVNACSASVLNPTSGLSPGAMVVTPTGGGAAQLMLDAFKFRMAGLSR